jgi:hypothetical protein
MGPRQWDRQSPQKTRRTDIADGPLGDVRSDYGTRSGRARVSMHSVVDLEVNVTSRRRRLLAGCVGLVGMRPTRGARYSAGSTRALHREPLLVCSRTVKDSSVSLWSSDWPRRSPSRRTAVLSSGSLRVAPDCTSESSRVGASAPA